MKKLLLVASLVSVFAAANAMADVTASATASWDATATKDTTSLLVVTPLNSLTFQYAEGLNGFNTQDGAFDVTIQGQESATDFELTAQVISNTLTNASGDASTLNVGVAWNGQALSNSAETVLVNAASTSGLESLLADGAYNGAERVSDQSSFKFSIASATSDGSTAITDYSALPDGYWTGDVKVQFNATWTTPA
ncbi:common pilus major fimbrillin subunit EcpA [Enterobacter ludwigii]|uniref:common pilus major fimbrillin subunit EcpA n=1 Tax=Enterobacter ludwigii TaxID=299767 RepID=UPI003975D937